MSTEALRAASTPRLSPAAVTALLHAVLAVLVLVTSVSAFAVSTVFGVAATFAMMLGVTVLLPASVPFIIATAFLFQNAVVAWYTPLIPDNTSFDALRGSNFIILMTAFAAFFAAAFQPRMLVIAAIRPWLIGGMLLGAVIVFYLGLGAIHGEAKDAVVYFRNVITPIACFFIAVIASSLYRIDLRRLIPWLAGAAIFYGYCELTFSMDFLSLFHGDQYIERDIWRQIQTGVWERALHETGFVLRNLQDVMMTDVFNLPMLSGILPKVFRIGGPTFHSISYAYGLGIASVWLLFNKRWVLPLLALPLLVIIGSKGAMVLLLLAIFVRVAAPLIGARLSLILMTLGAAAWIAGSILFGMRNGDYHVLGLFAGVRDFLHNPLGVGLGFGGNLSSDAITINWEQSQADGVAGVPMESAIGVMIYQMGIGSLAYLGFLVAVARTAWRAYRRSGDFSLLFLYVGTVVISANAVLQEEAFFSPLALGFCLLLGGVSLGTHWNRERARGFAASPLSR
jgi:hypothetical protein